MENHPFEWKNQRTQWQFSIANCKFTRGYSTKIPATIATGVHPTTCWCVSEKHWEETTQFFGLDREHDDSPLEVSNFQPYLGFCLTF